MMPEIDIQRLAPRFLLNEKNGYALAKAIEAAAKRAVAVVNAGLSELLDVARMSEWRLDEMAWEWNVTWYDFDADLETKRRTIASRMDVFSSAGTPSAVQAVIEQYFGDGDVEEWLDYGAAPYHFRVTTANPRATSESARQLAALVDLVKNARSVYDGAIVERAAQLLLRMLQRATVGVVREFVERG